jgi:hypothetical protein
MPVKNRNMVTAPKKRLVGKQPHLLAYITPAEAALLKKNGGTGEMVDGIPAFRPVKGKTSRGKSSAGTGFSGGSSGGSSSSGGGNNNNNNNNNDNDGPSAAEIAAANAAANAAAAEKVARELAAANAQREKAAAEAKAVADAEAKRIADAEAKAVADAEAKAIADQAAIDAAALATSPTDVSNVYNFYETDPVAGYTADDLNLGIGAVDPVTTTTTSPTDDSNVYDFYEPDISLDAVSTTTYPAPPPDPILPDDRGYPDVYDPTPFEGPATDDDLGLTDAPISDYYNTEDPYEPNLLDPQTDDDLGFDTYDDTDIFDTDPYSPNIMDYQTDDDLGFETPLDTTDIFGPNVDLIQDPVTGYVRPMTVQELEQGAFDTRFSYAAPDNVLDTNIGTLDPSSFSTGATITGTSPTDTANVYNFDNIAGVDPFTDTTDFNIGGFDTGPDVDTTAPSGLTGSTDLLGDPINLGTVSPTDLSNVYDFYNEPDSVIGTNTNTLEVDKTAPNAGAGFTDAAGVGTETHSVTIEDKGASPSGYNSVEDASDYNQSFDPTDTTGTTDGYTLNDLDLGTGYTNTTKFPSNNTVYDDSKKPLRIELTNPMGTGEETKITTNASGAKVYSNGMTEAEMRALYGKYGTAPNDTESKIMRNIMATERHAEDGPIDPKTGKPIYNSGDLVFDERGIDKFNSAANDVTGFFLQGISNGIFGRNFSKNQAKNLADKNKKALEALQKTGKYAYSADGKTAIGVVDTDGTVIQLRMDPSVVEENDSDPYPVCEPGYILVNGVCVPDDSLGTGDGGGGSGTEGRYGGTFGGPIIRPTTPRTPRTPVVTQPTLPAPTVRKPKQFAMGGEVSPGLITAADRFLASLKG